MGISSIWSICSKPYINMHENDQVATHSPYGINFSEVLPKSLPYNIAFLVGSRCPLPYDTIFSVGIRKCPYLTI